MLEGMRRNGASVFIYIIFGILIAVFVINFGPQSQGGPGGCSENSQSDTAITVAGEKVRAPTAFRAVYSFFKNNGARDQEAKTSALEFLMRRELLAQAAEERGLVTNEAMVEEEIKRGFIFIGGQRVPMHSVFFDKQEDASFFNYRGFEGFVGSLNVTLSVFMNEQVRELLAALQAESLKSSVLASRDEALAEFVYEGNTATYDVVAFSPRTYRDAFLVSEEDVARYLAAHTDEVQAKFKAEERLYKGVKPQVHVRQIFVAKAKPAAAPAPAPAAPAAGATAAPVAPESPAPAAVADAGKAKLEAARTEILAKKRTFVEVAKQLSSEAVERASGGDQGWLTKETPTLPETALNDAVKALKVGEVSEVITTDHGFYLVTVQEERQGDLTFDQVKTELAVDLAKEGWAKEAARRSALAALDAAQRGAIKDLNKLYKATARPSPGTRDIQQLLNDPSLTPEMKQQLLQQFLQQSGDKSGSLSFESENVPAAWTDDQAPAGGAAAPAAGGAAAPAAGGAAAPTAAPAAAPAAPAAPAAEAAAPAAGAVAPPVVPAAPAEPTAAELMKPSTELLPEMAAVEPPNVERAGPTPRASRLPELGTSKLAAKAVFDDLAAGQLSQQIYEVDGSYVLVQLIERQQPKMEDFDKDADQRVRTLRDQRGQALVEGWLKERCESLVKANRIKANTALTRESDDQGKLGPSFYKPCMSFR